MERFIEHSVLKASPLIICNRMKDYLFCHHSHPYRLYSCPCCYNWLPQILTYYESTKRAFIFKHTGLESHIILFFRLYGSFLPHHQLAVHTKAKHLCPHKANGRFSTPLSCFVYTVNISKHLDHHLKSAFLHLFLVAIQAQPLSVLKQN